MEYLAITTGTSRGRDTYGYNIVTLTDGNGKKFRAMGGGYDLLGTVFGDYLQYAYQDELLAIKERAAASRSNGERTPSELKPCYAWDGDGTGYLDGMTYLADTNRIVLEGATGISAMLKISRAIGLTVERTYKATGRNKGQTTGYLIGKGN